MKEELADISDLQDYNKSRVNEKIEMLKEGLAPLAKELKDLELKKETIEIDLKDTNKKIMDVQDRIRKLWAPHIIGAEKAAINCNGILLETVPTLSVKVDVDGDEAFHDSFESDDIGPREKAIEWLMSHDYKGIMKWDCNTNKMYKIARDLYEQDIKIPGLKYFHYQKIKVK